MEVMRKEMEMVGLNNDYDHNHDDHDELEPQGGNKPISNKNNKNDQRTMLRTPADIFEHPSFYSFVLDMPGLDALNIKVKVENGILHVTGKKKKTQTGETTSESEGVKAIRLERRRARYMRKFTLPPNANHEDVKVTYKDGVLSITVAKKLPVVQHSNNHNITIS